MVSSERLLPQCNTWVYCDKSEGCGACNTADMTAMGVADPTKFAPNSKYWCNDANKFPWFAPLLSQQLDHRRTVSRVPRLTGFPERHMCVKLLHNK